MTRYQKAPAQAGAPTSLAGERRWKLQDAKARFSELVRRVHSEGPQHVTVHGRDEVVVVSADEFRRLKGGRTGAAIVAAIQASPYRDIELVPESVVMPIRDVEL